MQWVQWPAPPGAPEAGNKVRSERDKGSDLRSDERLVNVLDRYVERHADEQAAAVTGLQPDARREIKISGRFLFEVESPRVRRVERRAVVEITEQDPAPDGSIKACRTSTLAEQVPAQAR